MKEPQIVIEYRPALHNPPRTSPLILGSPANGLTIIPGVSSYSKESWEGLKSLPIVWETVKLLLDEGVLRVVSQDSEETKTSLLPANQNQAIALIKKTFSLELLQLWLKNDTRAAVQKAIKEQMKVDSSSEEEEKPKATKTVKTKKSEEPTQLV